MNVVLGGDGVKAAQIMEKEFATPYIILDYPYGLNQSVEFLEKICKELGKKTSDKFIEEEKSKRCYTKFIYICRVFPAPQLQL